MQVTFSMMEIYNEQVRDLLNPASLKIKGGLKVRQHPNKGFYGRYLGDFDPRLHNILIVFIFVKLE